MEPNKNVVLLSMVGTGIIITVSDIEDGGIKGTHLLALGIVYLSLTAAQDIAPKVAVPFALLVFTGVALTKGAGIVNSIGNIGKGATIPGYGQNPSQATPNNSNPNASATNYDAGPRTVQRTAPPSNGGTRGDTGSGRGRQQ